jgi:succinate dehydrogenase / fumarate reductase cytochrome b subunit
MGILSSSIARKVAMALSAFFLMFFLLQHLAINSLSVFNPDLFNEVSHFMGTNPLVQFVLQPILMFAVIFHFVMGFILDIKNRKAKGSSYAKNNGAANSSWMSRNMVISGITILIFLLIHMIDFWIHEMSVKYVAGDMTGLINPSDTESGFRYYEELIVKFEPIWRVILYCLGFIFLGLHLAHGFSSAFQSVGAASLRVKLNKVGVLYSILVPIGFIFIAVYHFFNH